MTRSTSIRTIGIIGAVLAAAALGLAACAPEPVPATSPSPSASTSPEPYNGPAVFVGDELDLLLLTPEEIAQVLPGATEISDPSSTLEQISDGGGPEPAPAICFALFAEQSLRSVGSRTVSWDVPADPEVGIGRLHVLQFADEAQAQARMDQLMAAAEQCARFDYNGPATFDSVTAEPGDNARAFAGTLSIDEIEGGGSMFHAFAAVGNVIVQLWHPTLPESPADAQATADLLRDRAEEARAALFEDLTANPPTPEQPPTTDAAAPWGEWPITADGVGPILLSDTVDVALAAVEGAQVQEPTYDGGPWTLTNADGSASMQIDVQEEDDTKISSITVGNSRTHDEAVQDGTVLPSRGDVRVGALVADAVAAYPGGTSVSVVSSGDEWYDASTRDGHVFRFRTDRAASDPAAVIVGITVADATMWPTPDFR